MELTAQWGWQRKDSVKEITQSEEREKKDEEKSEQRLRDLWHYKKKYNIHVTEIPGEKK